MKKLLVIVLAVLLLCPGSLPAFAEEEPTPAVRSGYIRRELPEGIIEMTARGDGTAAITRATLQDVEDYTIPSEIDGVTITDIGESAFYNCECLVTLTIPDTVTSIADSAISWCLNLKEVNLPDSVTSIGDHAFHSCTHLESINIPDSVTSIGSGVFTCCYQLADIRISPDHPVFTFSNNALIDKRERVFKQHIGQGTGTYVIPRRIEKIGAQAFDFINIITVEIPEGVTSIEDCAFSGMRYLKRISIPDSVASIGYKAFYGDINLEAVRIPAGVTEIGGGSFAWCDKLSIEVDPANPVFEMRDNMLINKAEHKLCFHQNRDNGTLEVPEGIEIIDNCAFENSRNLTEIILPDTVKEIGQDAFACCLSLTSLRLPVGLKTIPQSMLRDSNSLRSITIPEGTEMIESLAFWKCENLEEAILPASLIRIGINAFADCSGLVCKVTEGSTAQYLCEENNIPYTIR